MEAFEVQISVVNRILASNLHQKHDKLRMIFAKVRKGGEESEELRMGQEEPLGPCSSKEV